MSTSSNTTGQTPVSSDEKKDAVTSLNETPMVASDDNAALFFRATSEEEVEDGDERCTTIMDTETDKVGQSSWLSSIPCYGIVFFVIGFASYSAITAIFLQSDSTSSSDMTMTMDEYTMNAIMELGLFGFTTLLALHMWWITRNETSTMAIGSAALGWLNKAFCSAFISSSSSTTSSSHVSDNPNSDSDGGGDINGVSGSDGNTMMHTNEFMISTTITYVLWTIASFFLTVTVYEAWKRIFRRGKQKRFGSSFGALLRARLSFLLVAISMLVIVAGCIIGSTTSTADGGDTTKVFQIGRIMWHVSGTLFVVFSALIWDTRAVEHTVTMWGLRNSRAGSILIVVSILTLALYATVSFVLQQYIIYMDYVIYFGAAFSMYLIHNLLFSIFPRHKTKAVKTNNIQNVNVNEPEIEMDTSSSGSNSFTQSEPVLEQTGSVIQGIESDVFYRRFLYYSALFSTPSQEMVAAASRSFEEEVEEVEDEDVVSVADDDNTKDDIENQMTAQNVRSLAPVACLSPTGNRSVSDNKSTKAPESENLIGWVYSLLFQTHHPAMGSNDSNEKQVEAEPKIVEADEKTQNVDCLPLCTGLMGFSNRVQPQFDLADCPTSQDDVPDTIVTDTDLPMSLSGISKCSDLTHSSRGNRVTAKNLGRIKPDQTVLKDKEENGISQTEFDIPTSSKPKESARMDSTQNETSNAKSTSFDYSIQVENTSEVASKNDAQQHVQVNIRPTTINALERKEKAVESNETPSEQLHLRSLAAKWRQKASSDKAEEGIVAKESGKTSTQKDLTTGQKKQRTVPSLATYFSKSSDNIPVSKVSSSKKQLNEDRDVDEEGGDKEVSDNRQQHSNHNVVIVSGNNILRSSTSPDVEKKRETSKKRNVKKSEKSTSNHKSEDDNLSVPSTVPMKLNQSDDSVSEFGTDAESVVSVWKRSLVEKRKSQNNSKSKHKIKKKATQISRQDGRDDLPKRAKRLVQPSNDERDIS
mmetsp:Transcript_6034/g.14984  ORF Transcript_6034/g.14984 Transcript_6034/m.14984 type:complete len:980 (-) Transcript_6034:1596-4535(-)